MDKLVLLCLLVVLIFGIGAFTFRPDGGVGSNVSKSHENLLQTARSFDYVTN